MGFIEDTCLAWSLFSFPFEERRSHGRGVTERLSRLSWTRTAVPNELLLMFLLWLWRLQPKGQAAVEKELHPVCQWCRIHAGLEISLWSQGKALMDLEAGGCTALYQHRSSGSSSS